MFPDWLSAANRNSAPLRQRWSAAARLLRERYCLAIMAVLLILGGRWGMQWQLQPWLAPWVLSVCVLFSALSLAALWGRGFAVTSRQRLAAAGAWCALFAGGFYLGLQARPIESDSLSLVASRIGRGIEGEEGPEGTGLGEVDVEDAEVQRDVGDLGAVGVDEGPGGGVQAGFDAIGNYDGDVEGIVGVGGEVHDVLVIEDVAGGLEAAFDEVGCVAYLEEADAADEGIASGDDSAVGSGEVAEGEGDSLEGFFSEVSPVVSAGVGSEVLCKIVGGGDSGLDVVLDVEYVADGGPAGVAGVAALAATDGLEHV